MVSLYLASVEAAGKTALCAGIGRKLLKDGKKVGFFKPVQFSEPDSVDAYEDIIFIKDALELEESVEVLSPIRLSRQDLGQSLTDKPQELTQKIRQASTLIAQGKDIVIMEGLGQLGSDEVSTQAFYSTAEAFDAKVIIILRYSPDLSPKRIAAICEELKQKLMGVIINFVPGSKIEAVRQDMTPLFQEAGIKVLGILPEDRSLLGVSVSELAKALDGEIMTHPENSGDVVENIMLGAMTIDSGIDYFKRKINKAAVIRDERADMQLAALETSTKCLILTNNSRPLSVVVSQAEDKGVPIMVVKQNTSGAIAVIEEALARTKFHNQRKLHRLEEILDEYLDFAALYSELGIKA